MNDENLFDRHPRLAEDADVIRDADHHEPEQDFDVKLPEPERSQKKRSPGLRRGPFFLSDATLVQLLAKAGYDASSIPPNLRRTALAVVGCWQKGIHAEHDVAASIGRNAKLVARLAELLRVAGAP